MRVLLRRLGVLTAIAAIVLVALPATVSADCTGPVCGEVEQGLDALGVVLLVVLLTVFVAVMALGGRILRRDRRSND
jgi:hypothetical protein